MPLLDVSVTDWVVSNSPVDYRHAVALMDRRVDAIHKGQAPELVWLLEHPPLYTAGTSAKPSGLTDPDRFPVHQTGRGGQYTYHGPGQRVAYVMLDLNKRGRDIHAYVRGLQDWVIAALSEFGIESERQNERPGVWVRRKDGAGEDKIAAIGVRVRRWVTFHGVSININPNLEHYSGIVPCGLHDYGVTSFANLVIACSMQQFDQSLRSKFEAAFGPTFEGSAPDFSAED